MQKKRTYISALAVGDEVNGCYLLRTAQIKTSASGKPFLRAELMDRTGSIEAKIWDYSGPISSADEGGVVVVQQGSVSEFRGALQVILGGIRLARPDEAFDPAELVPAAPIDAEQVFQEVSALVDSIQDPDYRALCQVMLERHGASFQRIPAGKRVHHAFLNGLLMHTAHMLKIAAFLAEVYPEVLDRSLLLAGTLLHDFGKVREFAVSPLGLVTDYSPEGNLLGHLVIGAEEVAAVARELGLPAEKTMLLQHLLLSHHGEPEFGAAVRPACAESEVLALVDRLDSRVEIYRENLEELAPGSFSQRIFALDGRIYRHT